MSIADVSFEQTEPHVLSAIEPISLNGLVKALKKFGRHFKKHRLSERGWMML